MISKNITRENILKAVSEIDKDGIPANRHSTKFHLFFNQKFYPPKYILSIANKYANGEELCPINFSGGKESNSFLINLGFEIREGRDSIEKKPGDIDVSVVLTAIIESDDHYDNKSRFALLEEILSKSENNADVIVLPGGFLKFSKFSDVDLKSIEQTVKGLMQKTNKNLVVCFGIDAPVEKHQLGIAISPKEIVAFGRKFHPTEDEKDELVAAKSANEQEFGFERVFNWKGKKYFLAVCYDSFGIKHFELPRQNIDFIIDLIHGFYPKGDGPSGEVYFAKNGLAGAAKQWHCPAFGSAVFFNRLLPPAWPSGVIWRKGSMNTPDWKYKYNPLHFSSIKEFTTKHEKVIMRYFNVASR
jgi:hypothetical protein